MTMNKFQFLMFSLLAAIVIIPPLLSSSLRPTYIYLIINIAIISLGAEAGLLSRSVWSTNNSQVEDNYNHNSNFVAPKETQEALTDHHHPQANKVVVVPRIVEKSVSKIVNLGKVDVVQKCLAIPLIVPSLVKVDVVKKCLAVPIIPSIPSLFFIGDGDESESESTETETETDEEEEELQEEEEELYEEEEEDFGGLSGQELFTQTENFIGNFYKQLRMQNSIKA